MKRGDIPRALRQRERRCGNEVRALERRETEHEAHRAVGTETDIEEVYGGNRPAKVHFEAMSFPRADRFFFGFLALASLAACESNPDVCPVSPDASRLPNGELPAEALPAGACASEGDRCQQAAATRCNDAGASAGYSQYECTCANGQWRCEKVLPGASKCADAKVGG